MDDKPPLIDLQPHRVGCSLHMSPFRKQWPSGYPTFVLRLFEELVADKEFQKEVKDTRFEKAVTTALDRLPMCCRLTKDSLMKVYLAVAESVPGLWPTAQCVLCRVVALGSELNQQVYRRVKTHEHVCFDCLLNRLREVQ